MVGNIKQIMFFFIVLFYLVYILITTNDTFTRILVILFLLFAVSLLMKQVCLVFKKNKMAKVSSKINAIVFFIYYFGFLIFF